MKRKTFSKGEKLAVVHEIDSGNSVAQVCREHEITPSMASRWKREYERDPARAFAGRGHAISLEARNAELERTVGKLHMQVDFLKKCLESLQTRLAESRTER